MLIRSITLHGFKSFGNRTTLELSPRISVIAGPNGSGKSNVVDALRWATGGGRASEFRAGEKTELIFHGASGKRSLGYAEVEVELQNDGRIAVQRTLQRDGSGRLRLNGRNARFMDIDEALSGSGLGKGSLAIIGQGEISSVLMADPSRLLSFVAEAAGVARLAGRREIAEDRLTRARDHMERLHDLVDEQERQLARLEEEAEAAARQAELSRESLALQFTIAGLRKQSLEVELRELTDQERVLQQTVTALQDDRQFLNQNLRERREKLAVQQETYRQATARLEAWKGEVRLAEGRQQALRDRLTGLRRQLGAMEAELAQLQQAAEPVPPEGDRASLEANATRLQAVASGLEEDYGTLEEEARAARQELEQLQARTTDRERQLALFEERVRSVQEQLDATDQRLEATQETEEAETPSRGPELEQQLAEALSLLDELRGQLAAAQEEHAHALAEARSLEVSRQRLQAAIDARSGFTQGPRIALAAGIDGVIGAVADLLQLDEESRLAIAAALGARSEFVVVTDAEVAQKVIALVSSKNAYVTVLPLDLVRPQRQQTASALLNAAGVIGAATEQISFEPRYESLFNQLLGNTLIMRDLTSAVALARSQPDRPRLVTLAGEILDRGGAMSGGRRNSNAGVLGQTRELAALEEQAAATRLQSDKAHAALLELQGQVRAGQESSRQLQEELEQVRRQEARRAQERAVREHLLADLQSRRERLQEQLTALQAQELPAEVPPEVIQAAREEAERTSQALARHGQELSAAVSASSSAQRELAVWQERQAAYSAAVSRHRADQERAASLQTASASLREEASGLEQQLRNAASEAESLAANPPVQLESVQADYQEARLQLVGAEERLEGTTQELDGHQQQLERLRLTLVRRETMLQTAVEETQRFPPGITAVEGSERTLRARLAEASRELEELGPVNHRALSELEQERLRSRQLASDLLDAEEAAAELLQSLEQVDQEVSSRSEAAIEAVRAAFVTHVAELFGPEAEAGIETVRENGRPTGLTMKLQPPGKRTTQLNLLSVGERTMGALAFLFSLMDGSGSRGLPIAVLDEVDAPLDEANIRRFTTFVERMADRGTQFLLISHQKTTFGIADSMWGVTSDKGVSSVFSIRREAQAAELTLNRGPN